MSPNVNVEETPCPLKLLLFWAKTGIMLGETNLLCSSNRYAL